MRIARPRLRVSQGESAFAVGNARWTNLDLDPIAKERRKWGVSSLVGALISLYFADRAHSTLQHIGSQMPSMPQPGSLRVASLQWD